jgi:single-stranded-DNA-specific exonuclease
MHELSLTGRRWTVKNDGILDDVVATLLRDRKIEALGEGEIVTEFGHDGTKFRDFGKAAERIKRAIDKKESVTIFGDYDCDGISATCLMLRFFKRHGLQAHARLPHRVRDGYGLKPGIVEECASRGTQLIVTVDTGVTAAESVALANKKGIDVVIIDHHQLPETLPAATAILHPSLADEEMSPSPCGAGVAFSFIRAYEKGEEWDDFETDVALAAIATVADVMELRGENRTLTHRGLQALATIESGPLHLLCVHAGLRAPYSTRDIGFGIAPRINAAGRMADPVIALLALLGDEPSLMRLQELNNERRLLVDDLCEELFATAEKSDHSILCFADKRFSAGVCGLLAGKLAERFGKPSIVGWIDGETCTASLRSVAGYNVTDGLTRAAELLENFGGHAMAAGCTFRAKNFSELSRRLAADVTEYVKDWTPVLDADAHLDASFVTEEFCEQLRALEPFGQGNPEPRFVVSGATLENMRTVGRDKRHLQATVAGKKAIAFGLGHVKVPNDQKVDLLCRIGMNEWNGKRSPQLQVDDVRLAKVI